MIVFCTGFSKLEAPEQALDGIPLGLGLVMAMHETLVYYTGEEAILLATTHI